MDLELVQNFCDTLTNHVARHRALVAGIILENSPETELHPCGLPAITVIGKEEMAMEIQDSVHWLIAGITEMAVMLGLPIAPQPLLTELARHLPEPYRSRVREDAADLEYLKNIILRENELSSHYIEEAMRLVCGNLNVLNGFSTHICDSYPILSQSDPRRK